jgi:hypothetical protein
MIKNDYAKWITNFLPQAFANFLSGANEKFLHHL